MLNLNDIYYFVRVVDSKGFGAAGRELRIPKSTLSKRISALEKSLGARLLLRNARSFTVSKVGQEFYDRAVIMLREAEAAERVVRRRTAEPSGVVRVTMSMTTALVAMSSVLQQLSKRYPKIQVELHATNRYVDLVREGFDVAARAHYEALPDSGLAQRRLGYSPMYLVASPAYLQECPPLRVPSDLQTCEALLTQPSSAPTAWKLVDSSGAGSEVVPSARYFIDEPVTLLNAAAASLGIACLPQELCATALETGRLVRVLPDWSVKGASMTLLTPHRRLRLPAVAAMLEILSTELTTGLGLQ